MTSGPPSPGVPRVRRLGWHHVAGEGRRPRDGECPTPAPCSTSTARTSRTGTCGLARPAGRRLPGRARASAPATSCRCSCRTGSRPSWSRSASRHSGAVINPLLPELPEPRARARLHDRAAPRDLHSRYVPRLRPRASSSPTSQHATGVHAGARGAATGRHRSGVALDDVLAREDRCGPDPGARRRRRVRADLHVGHRGDAQGDHAHRADDELQRAGRRTATSAITARRRGVDAVAGRSLHRVQLRPALRAVPRAAARAPGPVGPGGRRSTSCAGSGARTPWPRRRSCRTWSRSRRGAAPGSTRSAASVAAARRCPRAGRGGATRTASGCCGSTARPRCWSAPGTGPDVAPREAPTCTPTATSMSRRRRSQLRRATGEIFVRGPNTCVGFFADPERTAATFDADGLGALAATSPRSTTDGTLTIVGRKKEIIIRGGMNITPREIEELIGGFAEVRTRRGRRHPRRPPRRARAARAWSCDPGAALDLETMVERLRADRPRHVQAPATARGARRAADHRVGQDPEARDPPSPSTERRHDRARTRPARRPGATTRGGH